MVVINKVKGSLTLLSRVATKLCKVQKHFQQHIDEDINKLKKANKNLNDSQNQYIYENDSGRSETCPRYCAKQVWGLFWILSRTVLDQNQGCFEHDWGTFRTWLRNVLSPNRDGVKHVWGWSESGLKQDQDWTMTCSGPTGATEMPKKKYIYYIHVYNIYKEIWLAEGQASNSLPPMWQGFEQFWK